MDYQDILKNYTFNEDSLIDYGFYQDGNDYLFSKKINNQFIMEVRINNKGLFVRVLDKDNLEEYIPFKIDSINGTYVQSIRDLVNQEIDVILKKCFNKNQILDNVLEYVAIKFGTIPDHPFDDDSIVFRVNRKWYGLIMQIDKSKIMDSKGKCVIINLKIDKDKIPHIIDNKNIFKAYHMNKKYWISVLIDNNIDIKYLYELINESYSLVVK